MKYIYKVFLFENGQKSTDLSTYLTTPLFLEDRLNEELDTGEIILDCMPISTKFDFPPKTKIRIERYIEYNLQKKWDMIVEHDDVEEYVGVSNLCCHRIHLIEPSAIAQGIHVDNISLTYELQDVNLYYKTYNSDSNIDAPIYYPSKQLQSPKKSPNNPYGNLKYNSTTDGKETNIFENTYNLQWRNLESVILLQKNIDAWESKKITLDLPTLIIQGCLTESKFVDLFEINTKTQIFRTTTINHELQPETRICIAEKNNGPASLELESTPAYEVRKVDKKNCAYLRYVNNIDYNGITQFAKYFSVYPNIIAIADESYLDKTLEFSTSILSEEDVNNGKGYLYEIVCSVSSSDFDKIPTKYEHIVNTDWRFNTKTQSNKFDDFILRSDMSFYANFYVTNNPVEFSPFLVKGVKYSCYDLLRKTLLTIDTQIIENGVTSIDNIEYFLKIDEAWLNKLKMTQVYETTFEQKNLWEVLLQIGHYLHAIPYLEFAEGEDRFVLNFRQLGGKVKKEDSSTKITIFNSKNLSEYFTQFDSYITNLFSPQNDIEEWLTVKTDDSSYLISNDTAILKTTYNISEVVEFDILYKGNKKSALNYIFEKSIYDILTSDYRISPGKGYSLYYSLGDNIIRGLNYTPPTRNKDGYMSLKSIVATLFDDVNRTKLKYNDLLFHIKYKTQDSLRLTQVRPDLENFIKNSSYEKYPHHEQFYGQQDKIIDSEKMSLNLLGRLIQVGNNICQCQERVNSIEDEKEAGDLVIIDNEPYYVTMVENEYYPDATFQKVTYSKNYNQLSQIVTIPSEPRFYEVSERSKIRREVRLMEFFEIGNKNEVEHKGKPRYFNSNYLDVNDEFNFKSWAYFLDNLIFNKNKVELPNYAFTRFTSDSLRVHKGSKGQILRQDEMFPSVEVERISDNIIQPAKSSDHADIIVPLIHYPIHSGIVFEWDMEDNFKAGDCVDTDIKEAVNVDLGDDAYFAMQSVRYCDIMGRAELCTFNLFNKTDFTFEETQKLPKGIYIPSVDESNAYVHDSKYIALDKDGREAISFNLQINLLHKLDEYGDDFVTFPNLFGEKESSLCCALLDYEISLFDNHIEMQRAVIKNLEYYITYSVTLRFNGEKDYHSAIEIEFDKTKTIDLSKVKSIVFYQQSENGVIPYLAKNVGNAPNDKKLQSLAIYPVFND